MLDSIRQSAHTATMDIAAHDPKNRLPSLTRRMRDMSREERRVVMAAAAGAMAEYYRTDPEIREWRALDGEDFYDTSDETL